MQVIDQGHCSTNLGRGDSAQKSALRKWEDRARLIEQGALLATGHRRDNELHMQRQREWAKDREVSERGDLFGGLGCAPRNYAAMDYPPTVLNAMCQNVQLGLKQPAAGGSSATRYIGHNYAVHDNWAITT